MRRLPDTPSEPAPVIVGDEPGSFPHGVLAERHPAIIRQVREAFPFGPERRRALDELLASCASHPAAHPHAGLTAKGEFLMEFGHLARDETKISSCVTRFYDHCLPDRRTMRRLASALGAIAAVLTLTVTTPASATVGTQAEVKAGCELRGQTVLYGRVVSLWRCWGEDPTGWKYHANIHRAVPDDVIQLVKYPGGSGSAQILQQVPVAEGEIGANTASFHPDAGTTYTACGLTVTGQRACTVRA